MAQYSEPAIEQEETKEDDDKKDDKPNMRLWIARIDAAKTASKEYWNAADSAWQEYLSGMRRYSREDYSTKYPIYWSSVKTIQPALYSRTPKPVAERVFDALDDKIARVASMSLERLANYLISCTPFDRVQYAARDEYIHGGRATTRVCFDATIKERVEKKYYTPQPQMMPGMPPQYVGADGSPMPEGFELFEDENGSYLEQAEEYLEHAHVESVPVNYKDIIHSPNARHWEEITWIGFKSLLDKYDFRERFGDEFINQVPFQNYQAAAGIKNKESGEQSASDKEKSPSLYACVWEIWDKRTKKVYWYAEGFNQQMLDIKEDPYELVGFFPCAPFMLGTVGTDSLYPVPDFVQLESMVRQLHALSDRLRRLIRASRRRGLYDSGVPELKALESETDEAEFLGVNNFRELIGAADLGALVKYFPVQEIVNAIAQLSELIAAYDAKFNEMYGVPDILRGVSDPRETAAAQQQKGKYLSLRFSAAQREFQRLVRDNIEQMCDLALKKLPDQMLYEVMGYQFLPPDQQQNFAPALELLKNDTQRKIRINIQTDSTITMNEVEEIEQRKFLAETLFSGITALASTKQQLPALEPVVAQTVLYLIQGVREGQEIEESLKQSIALMQQQQAQPMQPPPLDPAVQKAQIDAQVQIQKAQLDQQTEMAKLQMHQQDLVLEAQKLQLEFQKLMVQSQNEQERTAIERQKTQLEAFIRTQTLEMDKQYLGLDMQEKYMEEERLSKQSEIDTIAALKPEKPEKQGPDVVNVNMVPEAPPIIPII